MTTQHTFDNFNQSKMQFSFLIDVELPDAAIPLKIVLLNAANLYQAVSLANQKIKEKSPGAKCCIIDAHSRKDFTEPWITVIKNGKYIE